MAASMVALLAGSIWITGRAQAGGPIVSGAHPFERIAEGIY
jgi:hypothetical protein